MDSDVFLLKPLDAIFSPQDILLDASLTVAPYAPWMAYFTLPMIKSFCEYIKCVFSLSDSRLFEVMTCGHCVIFYGVLKVRMPS
jgi:hypothetical protein